MPVVGRGGLRTARDGPPIGSNRRLILRLPEETFLELSAAARTIGQPQWRVIVSAVKVYIGAGPVLETADRDIVRRMLRRDAS